VKQVLITALLVVLALPASAGAQVPGAACTRVSLGAWTPPLDWSRAGHQDSTSAIAGHVRRLRDSVFAVAGGVGARESMHWLDEKGERRLVLYPAWWPAGVIIAFTKPPLGDTLVGEARALVADPSHGISTAPARVITRCRAEPEN
jgi:hypothetical protein